MAWCHRTMLAYWKFESISLQRRVCKPYAASHNAAADNSEKAVVKLSGILCGAVILLALTLVARAQGVGDARSECQSDQPECAGKSWALVPRY